MKNHISKKERALLTIAGAQRIAGAGRTPSARQVRKAHSEAGCAVAKHGVVVHGGADATDRMFNSVCTKLSGIGGETDAECGSFWGKLKSLVSSAASTAAPIAPLFGPAAGIALPMLAKKGGRGGSQAVAQAQPAAEQNVQEVTGWLSGTEISHPERGFTYIFGDDDDELGAEDRMLLREGGGMTEYASARRRQGRIPYPVANAGAFGPLRAIGDALPHNLYRAAILKRAHALGGKKPTAKHMADAQAAIDREMVAYGLRVGIPGARPGRVTR